MPGPRFEGLRITLSVLPSNAESPTPMYTIAYHSDRYNNYTSRGVPVALVLTDNLGGCEVLKASNPKRSENAFCYVCAPACSVAQGLPAFCDDKCKDKKIF